MCLSEGGGHPLKGRAKLEGYNRIVKLTYAVLFAALFVCGCSRNINNKDAVRQGVVDYLDQRKASTGLDMSRMNVEVSDVKFQKDEATATVSFIPKDTKTGGMSMNYALERKGDKWVVKGRKESGANPHGGQGMPGGMPESMGAPAMPGAGAEMPPGHPPTTTTTPDKK